MTKLPLYKFQEEGINFLCNNQFALLASEMGLGKSVQSIVAACRLKEQRGFTKVLIICPNTLKYSWADEIQKFTDESFKVIDGLKKVRDEQWQWDTFFTIINYEMLLCDDFGKHIVNTQWDVVICDEAVYIKNKASMRSRRAYMIPRKVRWALSGIPVEVSPMDLWGIAYFLHPLFLGNYYSYRGRYCELERKKMKGRWITLIKGFKNLDELNRRIKDIYLRRTKEEVFEQMPPKVYKVFKIDLTPQQRMWYNVLLRQTKEHYARNFNILGSITSMRMLCDSLKCYDEKMEPYSSKISLLLDLIDDGLTNAVIFTDWVTTLNEITKALAQAGQTFNTIYGDVPNAARAARVEEFRQGKVKFLVCTGAAEYGLNLQTSNNIVLFNLPWNFSKMQQRIDRIHRIGTKNTVFIYTFLTRNTIEEKVAEKLLDKKHMFDVIFAADKQKFLFENLGDEIL
jgi:SNF2 family DNA or RNA helicase